MYSEKGIYTMNREYLPNTQVYFTGCYLIDDDDQGPAFCNDGDSGAGVLIDGTDKALGLLIARSEISPYSIVCDIQMIVDLFNVDLFRRI